MLVKVDFQVRISLQRPIWL